MRIAKDEAIWPSPFLRASYLVFLLVGLGQLALLYFLLASLPSDRSWLPSVAGPAHQSDSQYFWRRSEPPQPYIEVDDEHPIRDLIHNADHDFAEYDSTRSKTFKEAVEKYRDRYGRHPPPHFDKWYKFARKRNVHDIDDFQQIHDDLRPFWSINPADLRHYAAHAADMAGHGVATVSIRNGRVFEGSSCSWRSGDFLHMLQSVTKYLPDMDIPMNRMDQPRVIVPWDELQAALEAETATRSLDSVGVDNSFTRRQSGLWKLKPFFLLPAWLDPIKALLQIPLDTPAEPSLKYGWFSHTNKPLMDLASQACPPDSYARNSTSTEHFEQAEKSYKHELGGFITNTNLSTDLCTVGPQLSHSHGLLYASTSMLVTQKLIPVFSECKTSVNSDILFPASIYYKQDENYDYDDDEDLSWEDKKDVLFWRGSTSGGNAYEKQPAAWRSMHRQRFVLSMNATEIQEEAVPILAGHLNDTYIPRNFTPSDFAAEHTDVGFTKKIACLPNCSFYGQTFTMLDWLPFSHAFKHKFLIDIDGHSFSGRWRAYMQSRSLALKATIIREWHSSRLRAWRHFVPVDNQYEDLYSVLTYFMGYTGPDGDVVVPRHDYEAYKIAKQGRDWASKVLRKEDMEIYLYRLLLEYARLIDDNRDRIGFVGDGGKEMEEFDRKYPAVDLPMRF